MENIENVEIIRVIIYIFFAFILMGSAVLVFVYFSRKKIIEQKIKNREKEIAHQKTLINAIIETQEKERNRIAQDLHDDISSGLNVVAINCYMLKTPNLDYNEQLKITNTILELTNKVLQSSRRIAHDLLPPVIDKFGLHEGIKELVENINNIGQLQIKYNNHLNFDDLAHEKHLHVFRILQELINNSLKHSEANTITIDFNQDSDGIKLHYSDNGKGFDVTNSVHKKGLGMKNIESRISLLQAKLTVDSKLNQGTHFLIHF
ncbi:sensor histidine kinase [Paucihalobacter ruber]|uniref:histidine kinase n=1 Tax=Paucihalobacter ruber TaxID=2567861 RepID=A0A506PJZ9_9FLAO|nr:sensor histidine kinase [Paucihalobacter ruber]TPV33422.1 sensor histidine kinase [Paucihalobacter ruber]